MPLRPAEFANNRAGLSVGGLRALADTGHGAAVLRDVVLHNRDPLAERLARATYVAPPRKEWAPWATRVDPGSRADAQLRADVDRWWDVVDAALERARERGVRVVQQRIPQARSLEDDLPAAAGAAFAARLRSAAELGLLTIAATPKVPPDDRFEDPIHLNRLGREVFTTFPDREHARGSALSDRNSARYALG